MEQHETPPLKRHPSLQPFSRDHYVGLRLAQHLLKAAGVDADAARRRAAVMEPIEVWEREIDSHFADEERLLLPLSDAADASRLMGEHASLRGLAVQARQERSRVDPDGEWMRTLGQALNDHIRWEERELFPAIERIAGAAKLEEIGRETDVIERRRRPRNDV